MTHLMFIGEVRILVNAKILDLNTNILNYINF